MILRPIRIRRYHGCGGDDDGGDCVRDALRLPVLVEELHACLEVDEAWRPNEEMYPLDAAVDEAWRPNVEMYPLDAAVAGSTCRRNFDS